MPLYKLSWYYFATWRRDMAKKRFSIWRPSAILNLQNLISIFFVKCPSWELKCTSAHQIWSKSDHSRLRYGDNAISKWRPSAILNLRKLQFWTRDLYWHCDPSSPLEISCWWANMAPRYSQKTIFNMASVRHLGFDMTSSYCIRKLHFTFPTLC